MKTRFGLLGRHIDYSFSKKFFTEKFKQEELSYTYENFDIPHIEELPVILNTHINNLIGFNVTQPYKKEIFNYLDDIDPVAKKINAVNTVKVIDGTYLKGYNTDFLGFMNSITPLLQKHHKKALVLGNGGATQAIKYALDELGIDYQVVSRNAKDTNCILYKDLSKEDMLNSIIINCTPVGTYPNVGACPDIPYNYLNENNLLYDLVYNPEISTFLKKGQERGASIKNGYEMLCIQAIEAWKIWTDSSL